MSAYKKSGRSEANSRWYTMRRTGSKMSCLVSIHKVTSSCHSGLSGIFPMMSWKDSRRASLAGMTTIESLLDRHNLVLPIFRAKDFRALKMGD